MTRKNKDVISLLSTGRVFRSYTFINLPYWEHLDNQVKSYLHAVCMVHRPDKKKGLSFYTPYLIRPQGYGKPPLTIKFRHRDKLTGRLYAINGCYTNLPTKTLNDAQQEKTNEWKKLVHQGLIGAGGGLISEEPVKRVVKEQLTKEQKFQKVNEVVKSVLPIHQKFQNGKKYSASRIRAYTGETREICEMVAFKLFEMLESKQIS